MNIHRGKTGLNNRGQYRSMGRRGGGRGGGRGRFRGEPRRRGAGGGDIEALPHTALNPGMEHFTRPKKRQLIDVPLTFGSLKEWGECIANNLLVEYYWTYRDPRGPRFTATATSGGEILLPEAFVGESFLQHLLKVDGGVHIVSSQSPDGRVLKVSPSVRAGTVRVVSAGYIGSYIAEHKAIVELVEQSRSKGLSPVLQTVLQPQLQIPGNYVFEPLCEQVPINASQRATVSQLRHCVEKVQGPPGTGKSTTVYHMLKSRISAHPARKLVTCSRNVAVESIVTKLLKINPNGLVVFGNAERVGDTARKFLLEARASKHPAVAKARWMSTWLHRVENEFESGFSQISQPRYGGRLWTRAFVAWGRMRYRSERTWMSWARRVHGAAMALTDALEYEAKLEILIEADILVGTIASGPRMMREWEDVTEEPLTCDTIVVDECGCTPESSVAMLLRLEPRNLILVGDHRQLPPCSLVPPQVLSTSGQGHTRSLLERCILASGTFHRLLEQYRMPAQVSSVVSHLYYHSALTTPKLVADNRGSAKIQWFRCHGREESPPGETSILNVEEAKCAVAVAARLRETYGSGASVAILTFYKGQKSEIAKTTPASLKVEVLTVDSCQGAEFDHVVLSTVRCNRGGLVGFVKDRQRVCVAISRSVRSLTIVGNAETLIGTPDWAIIYRSSEIHSAAGLASEGSAVGEGLQSKWEAETEAAAQARAQARNALLEDSVDWTQRHTRNTLRPEPHQTHNQTEVRHVVSGFISDTADFPPLPTLVSGGSDAGFVFGGSNTDDEDDETLDTPDRITVAQLFEIFEDRALVGATLKRMDGDTNRAMTALLETPKPTWQPSLDEIGFDPFGHDSWYALSDDETELDDDDAPLQHGDGDGIDHQPTTTSRGELEEPEDDSPFFLDFVDGDSQPELSEIVTSDVSSSFTPAPHLPKSHPEVVPPRSHLIAKGRGRGRRRKEAHESSQLAAPIPPMSLSAEAVCWPPPALVDKKVAALVDLGFTRDQAAAALATHTNTTDAADWLFSNVGGPAPKSKPLSAGEAWRVASNQVRAGSNDNVDRVAGRLRDELVGTKLTSVCQALHVSLDPELQAYAVSVLQVAAAEGDTSHSSEALLDVVRLLCEAGADEEGALALLSEALLQ